MKNVQGLDPDLIDIPEEFEDVPIANLRTKDVARKISNKKFIRTKSDRDMTNYDVWRCHDRTTHQMGSGHKAPNVAKYQIAPALLWRLFGIPCQPSYPIVSTGEYNFEDTNLDCYKLYDFK